MTKVKIFGLLLLALVVTSPAGGQPPPPNLATVDILSVSSSLNANGDLVVSFDIHGAANAGYDSFLFVDADTDPYASGAFGSETQVGFETDDADGTGKCTISFTVPAAQLPAAGNGWAWCVEVWFRQGGKADYAYGYVSK